MLEPTTERCYADWFEEPRSLPAGIARRDALAAEVGEIQRQLRIRKESATLDPDYTRWRTAAMHALRRKEQALIRYRAWCHEKHQTLRFTIAGLTDDTPTEELLYQAYLLLRQLLREGGYQAPCEEYDLLDALRIRVGLS